MSHFTVVQQSGENRNFNTAFSSSETAVNLPSWWSYNTVAVSWEIPPVFLHLDSSSLMHTFKDTWQTPQWSRPHRQQSRRALSSSCSGVREGRNVCVCVKGKQSRHRGFIWKTQCLCRCIKWSKNRLHAVLLRNMRDPRAAGEWWRKVMGLTETTKLKQPAVKDNKMLVILYIAHLLYKRMSLQQMWQSHLYHLFSWRSLQLY